MAKCVLRKKIINGLVYASILLFGLGLIFFSRETSAAAAEGLAICGNVLIPSLFPFFVVSQMAVQTGLAHRAGKAFTRPMKLLFNLPGACAPAFILGLIGGYPVGAKTAISLFEQRLCTKAEAERLLSFCNNSGPAFILGTVGTMVFGATSAGVLLYASHFLASVAVGIIFRGYKKTAVPSSAGGGITFSAVPLGKAFTVSVTSSFSSILNICSFVIFFSVAIRLLAISGVLPATAGVLSWIVSPLGLDAAFAEKLLSGLLEVTSGAHGLAAISASRGAKLSAAAFMLGWAGISVHCQVLNFIGDSGLSTIPYIGGKMLHGVFSAIFAFAGAWLLPYDVQVSKTITGQISALSGLTPTQSFGLALLTVILIWLLFFMASSRPKTRKPKARRQNNKA